MNGEFTHDVSFRVQGSECWGKQLEYVAELGSEQVLGGLDGALDGSMTCLSFCSLQRMEGFGLTTS